MAGELDWTLPLDQVSKQLNFQRSGATVQAKYGKGFTKQNARNKLERIAA